MTIEEMSIRMSEDQVRLMRNVRKEMKEVKCFKCHGVLFEGDMTLAAMNFAYNNPTGGDFYVWLQDNYKMIN